MRQSRRRLLASGGALFTTALAGCNALGASGGESAGAANGTDGGEGTASTDTAARAAVGPDTAVAAEWNAMRARLRDALALGLAGNPGAGAGVAGHVFERFERASGEYGAHEALERTSEPNYAEFEEALGELRTAGLEAGDLERAREEVDIAGRQLAAAQRALVDDATAHALDLQLFGATAADAAFLAATGHADAAGTVAANLAARFEDAAVHEALESADAESYETFEGALGDLESAAGAGDAEAAGVAADEALSAAVDGSYALADADRAGAGHMAVFQALGWDAAAVSRLGGPSTDFAHAAALNVYRARAYDCGWLAAHGETDRAATMAADVFAHFEGARAHEALEEADGEAYEGFEAGLSEMRTAIENGNGIDAAVETVDSNLVAGIEALAGSNAALLEAGFFRARFADARERYRLGANSAAATVAEGLFERFEANELGLHESVESASEELYTAFEEEHLSGLVTAFENTDDAGVSTHYDGVQSTLLSFETTAGTTATVSGAEASFMAARGFDAAVLDALGKDARARAIAQSAFEHFEAGAGGYHEAVEEADESLYAAFEEALGSVSTAAGDGEDVYPAAKRFNERAVDSAYAVVSSAGGSQAGVAASLVQDAFARFEEARVHERLEEADHNAYATFEAELEAYGTALEEGGDVAGAANAFANAAQYAAFALVDSVEELPLSLRLAGTGNSGSSGGESNLSGGPNVVEGVPDDADHVVDMNAVAFAPKDLTVQQGDTVAWVHAAGEAHTVFAYGESLPEGAAYWASGGFDSQSAAEEGWSNGKGAITSGHAYVHTFETAGTHRYFCAPHEAAGMVGSVTVE